MEKAQNMDIKALRETVFETDNEKEAEKLIGQCKNIHAVFLFHRPEGTSVLQVLCTVLTSTPSDIHYKSWKDFAGHLGLTFHQIGCIQNYKFGDPTEMVVKTFAQRKEATIDLIVLVLSKLKRFDAIMKMKTPMEGLINFVKQHESIEKDIGYHSLIDSSIKSDGILRPKSYKAISYELPLTLQGQMDTETQNYIQEEMQHLGIQEESIQRSCVIPHSPKVKCYKKVMLTFAKDGEVVAKDLAKKLRNNNEGKYPIGALILDEHPDKVMSNPERLIIHAFAKMDFIIPVLTQGYLDGLGRRPEPNMIWASCIDPQYIQFIHDLMSKYYRENGCRNDKFRCLVPDSHFDRVMRHPHMGLDPVLKIWERDVDNLVERILRSKKVKRP